MAIANGTNCVECEIEQARPYSHFCSPACSQSWMKTHKGPINCMACSLAFDTVREARKEKWKDIDEDPEGISWNWVGYCPECWKEYNAHPKKRVARQGELFGAKK